jgi:hypothetical protein
MMTRDISKRATRFEHDSNTIRTRFPGLSREIEWSGVEWSGVEWSESETTEISYQHDQRVRKNIQVD